MVSVTTINNCSSSGCESSGTTGDHYEQDVASRGPDSEARPAAVAGEPRQSSAESESTWTRWPEEVELSTASVESVAEVIDSDTDSTDIDEEMGIGMIEHTME